jgi:O-antigen ligase
LATHVLWSALLPLSGTLVRGTGSTLLNSRQLLSSIATTLGLVDPGTGPSGLAPVATSSNAVRQDRIRPEVLVVGASIITLGLAATQISGHDTFTLVPLLASLPLVVVSPKARVMVLMFGGLLVFQSSTGVSLLKSTYLGVAFIALLAAITRLIYLPDRRAIDLMRPLVVTAAVFAGVVILSLAVAIVERTALSDWVRDAAPYFLFCTVPIFALDFGTSMSRRYLISVFIAVGVLAALSFFVEWAGANRRQIFQLPITHLLLPSGLLSNALVCYSSSRAMTSEWRARIQWTVFSGALVAVLALLTGTRSFLAVLLIVPLIVSLAGRGRVVTRAFRGVLFAIAMLAIALVITWFVVHVTASNPPLVPDRFATSQVSTSDVSYRLRLQEFVAAVTVFLSSPLLGAGPGHIFHWSPIVGPAWNTFTLDTGMVVPAKFGLVGVAALAAICVALVLFLNKTALTSRAKTSWAALVAFAIVGVIGLVLGSPIEDKGFSFGMILILALVLADYQESVPTLELSASDRINSANRVSRFGRLVVAITSRR